MQALQDRASLTRRRGRWPSRMYMGGFSPGVLTEGLAKLPFADASLQETTVTIQSAEAGQPRVAAEATLRAFGQAQRLKLDANLRPASAVCLREEFIELEALGMKTLLPGPLASPASEGKI